MNLEQTLLQLCQEAIEQVSDESIVVTMETELNAEAGIDSLAFMNIIIAWEEALGKELDDLLGELHAAKTVGEAIKIIMM
jgi:acyl carrier protein